MNEYMPLQFLFEPNQGLIGALNQNFLEFRMETEEDVQLYLTLLADVERYLNEALTYTQNQARRGYFLQDVYKRQVLLVCHEKEFYTDLADAVWDLSEVSLRR